MIWCQQLKYVLLHVNIHVGLTDINCFHLSDIWEFYRSRNVHNTIIFPNKCHIRSFKRILWDKCDLCSFTRISAQTDWTEISKLFLKWFNSINHIDKNENILTYIHISSFYSYNEEFMAKESWKFRKLLFQTERLRRRVPETWNNCSPEFFLSRGVHPNLKIFLQCLFLASMWGSMRLDDASSMKRKLTLKPPKCVIYNYSFHPMSSDRNTYYEGMKRIG